MGDEPNGYLASLLFSSFCFSGSYFAVLPVLPVTIRDATGSTSQSGIVTATMAVGAIALELRTPHLLNRWPARSLLVVGQLAISLSMAGLAESHQLLLMAILGIGIGAGLGISSTAVSAAIGGLSGKRGRLLGLYSIAVGIPASFAPAVALFVLPRVGSSRVFLGCAVIALIGLVPLVFVRSLATKPRVGPRFGDAVRDLRVRLVLGAFLCVTMTFGAVASFSPFVISGHGISSASAFLFVFGLFRTAGRAIAGPLATRVHENRLTATSVIAVGIGLACLAEGRLPFLLASAALYGVGYGVFQTSSFVAILARVQRDGTAAAGGLWNFGSDGGIGLGALTLAPVGAAIGYHNLFFLLPLLALAALSIREAEHRLVTGGDTPDLGPSSGAP